MASHQKLKGLSLLREIEAMDLSAPARFLLDNADRAGELNEELENFSR